jgi:hypothetical protein
MNTWSEANFLERLMSPLLPKDDVKKRSCPDSGLLAAFSENRAGGFVSEAVEVHLRQCSDCAEVHRRLVNFGMADASMSAAEWKNTEKRLDNWMSSVLALQSSQAAVGVSPVASAPSMAPSWRIASWKTQWVLSAVAGLALVVASIFFWEFSFLQPNKLLAFRLPARTSVTIRLSSLHRLSDGTLLFQATLASPISAPGAAFLNRVDEIDGWETEENGETSLVIKDLVIHGLHYSLKGPLGRKIHPPSATGGQAVPFDTNQLVETFVDTPGNYATYVKVPDTAESQ